MADIMALPLLGVTEANAASYSIRISNVLRDIDPWTLLPEELDAHLFRCRWADKEKNRRHNIHSKKVLQFLNLRAGTPLYVFMGAFEVGELEQVPDGGLIYRHGVEDPALAGFSRRLVVRYVRGQGYQGMDFRLSNEKLLQSFLSGMTVEYIRSAPFALQPFCGYDQVLLDFHELAAAVNDEQWKTALGNVQAVYLQTDTLNGWHYVGSAYGKAGGQQGLLARWKEYAEGDHTGGNELLKAIPNAKEHIERYFRYSILEVFDMKTDAKTIVQREHWWMRVLDSMRDGKSSAPHGYNSGCNGL